MRASVAAFAPVRPGQFKSVVSDCLGTTLHPGGRSLSRSRASRATPRSPARDGSDGEVPERVAVRLVARAATVAREGWAAPGAAAPVRAAAAAPQPAL